jgi:hypothetical protein
MRSSMRGVCTQVGVDAGHMSRVLGGLSSFSVDTTDRILHRGKFRLSFIPQLSHRNEPDRVIDALVSPTPTGLRAFASWIRDSPPEEDASPHKWIQELLLAWGAPPHAYSTSHAYRLRRGQREFSWDSLANFAREFGCDLVFVPRHFPMGWADQETPSADLLQPDSAARPHLSTRSSTLGIFSGSAISTLPATGDENSDR